jgi:hypothetical protein
MCGSGSAHADGVSATVATVAIAAAATAITLVFVMRLPLCWNGCLMIDEELMLVNRRWT